MHVRAFFKILGFLLKTQWAQVFKIPLTLCMAALLIGFMPTSMNQYMGNIFILIFFALYFPFVQQSMQEHIHDGTYSWLMAAGVSPLRYYFLMCIQNLILYITPTLIFISLCANEINVWGLLLVMGSTLALVPTFVKFNPNDDFFGALLTFIPLQMGSFILLMLSFEMGEKVLWLLLGCFCSMLGIGLLSFCSTSLNVDDLA